jgi:hypothetical protein
MGLPVTLVALLISVEPLIDMGRTALNVSGSMTAGTLTSQWLRQTDKTILDSEDDAELAHRWQGIATPWQTESKPQAGRQKNRRAHRSAVFILCRIQEAISPSCRVCMAQRCADSGTLNAGERRKCSPISTKATYLPRNSHTSRKPSILTACSGGAGSTRGT